MVNILVVDDNFSYSKCLINKLVSDNANIRISYIATNGSEALNKIKEPNNDIDVILLDLVLPQISGFEILKYIEENNITKYKDSVIVLSGEVNKFPKNSSVHSSISKIKGFNFVINEIEDLIKTKEYCKLPIEKKVKNELEKLNYNFKYVGTTYLLETIILLYNQETNNRIKLEKNIYPIIAKKYNTTVHNIKINIINSTKEMYFDCAESTLFKTLKLVQGEKPKPKDVISSIIAKLKNFE
jgi:CheY-like chemotaxis protein